MKLSFFSLAGVILSLFLGASTKVRAGPKPIMVHYMPWFQSQTFSGAWGWHWTMNHFNPDVINPTNHQREIASWYYPLIGPYDSADPAVLEYHVLLMKLAGIDGVIVDWYGMDDFNDYAVNNARTVAMFNYARKAGLKFSLCYEDSTIQQEINGGLITAAGAIARAQQTMLYAQSNFFNDPVFLRWKTLPVLLNFGPQYFHDSSAWESIFSVLAPGNHPAFFTEDNRVSPAGSGVFDWPPMNLARTNALSPTEAVLSDAALDGYLTGFAKSVEGFPGFVSSAFPRFHDFYAQAGVQPSFGSLDDQDGATFRKTLSLAMTDASAFVQVVTWNDFGEGTVVEPTVQYGYRDLGVIQDYRRQYLDSSFPCTKNDLTLAARLYNLRKQYGKTNAVLSAEMDRIFTNIVSGDLTAAEMQLSGMESNVVVIYDASATNGLLRFSIGGLLSGVSLPVQNSLSLAPGGWTTVTNIPLSTNMPVFSGAIPVNNPDMFFKVLYVGQ